MLMSHEEKKNEIVIYQPNEIIRLEVVLQNETVWLSQSQMAELFGCSVDNIGLHLKNIYDIEELSKKATAEEFSVVRVEGGRKVRRKIILYNLEAIISVGYRVNTILGVRFRQWATAVLKEYLLKGYTVNARISILEDKMQKSIVMHENRIASLEEKVDFFVQTQTPPLQGVFFEGQLWDACSLVEKLISRAQKSILLIDSWVSIETLDMLAKKRSGVAVTIVTSKRGNKLATSDISKFNTQYPPLTIKESEAFHDRFLILDNKELYLIGASLKDLGKKCFAFTKMDSSQIQSIAVRV